MSDPKKLADKWAEIALPCDSLTYIDDLRKPSPCGVAGHMKADWHKEGDYLYGCRACTLEAALQAAIKESNELRRQLDEARRKVPDDKT